MQIFYADEFMYSSMHVNRHKATCNSSLDKHHIFILSLLNAFLFIDKM